MEKTKMYPPPATSPSRLPWRIKAWGSAGGAWEVGGPQLVFSPQVQPIQGPKLPINIGESRGHLCCRQPCPEAWFVQLWVCVVVM